MTRRLAIENFRIALRSIRSQLLRALITMAIIAIGITALVGILTAIDSIKLSLSSELSLMGANTFTIRTSQNRIFQDGISRKPDPPITYSQALDFKQRFDYPSDVSFFHRATFGATLTYRGKKSKPNVTVFGVDENYLSTAGYNVKYGRNISEQDLKANAHVCILGKELAENLFPYVDPLDKVISTGNGKFRVLGVLAEKGSSVQMGADRVCFLPVAASRQYYGSANLSYSLNVIAYSPDQLTPAVSEATGLMRILRRVPLREKDNFIVRRSDSLSELLIENLSSITLMATLIAVITLLGAAVAVMNIMLVSVTERTREIGTRKALGAPKKTIRSQFLMEAILICQMGGAMGVVLGILIGNILAFTSGTGFLIPWDWILGGVLTCALVGIVSGYYPAVKASQLDPIEALRHE